uniref:Uncharacterized protein n=1 Tax=Brassica oleracea TaxID=3712 RepID=A0A3P6E283_BRAOL|nr:unnamed protein product [Brassica oleracea]
MWRLLSLRCISRMELVLTFGQIFGVICSLSYKSWGNRKAKVAEAIDALGWKLQRCRGRVMQVIIEKINRVPPPRPDARKDRALWKQGPYIYQEKFVSKLTWDLLRSTQDKVVWFNIV